ncbi:hypothetical protein ACM66B_004985 [Microbotryomycetes sp. NB124-2]
MGSAADATAITQGTALAVAFDPQELQRAVEAQHSMRLRKVDSWYDLVRYRTTVDKNWLNMAHQRHKICLNLGERTVVPLHQGLFRFKLDPGNADDSAVIIASGLLGGLLAFTLDGNCVWSNPEPAHLWPHVEASSGYLIQPLGHGQGAREDHFVVWSRHHDEETFLDAEDVDILTGHAFDATVPQIQRFMPIEWFSLPAEVRATKLRFPYHLSASVASRKLFRYTLTSEQEPQQLDISRLWTDESMQDSSIRYVEILDDFALVAGSKAISIWDFGAEAGTDEFVAMFPPIPPTNLQNLWHHYRVSDSQPMFSAVHHDRVGNVGGNLVAATSRSHVSSSIDHGINGGSLLWAPRFDELLSFLRAGGTDIDNLCVVLRTDVLIAQLAVENGRCAFIGQVTGRTYGLWAFNLKPWTTLEDFKRDPPRPTCLSYPLPFLGDPARLEMTSDEIYVQASNVDFDLVTSQAESYQGDFTWESMSGESLSAVWKTCDSSLLHDVDEDWQSIRMRVRDTLPIEGNDAFLVFSFLDPDNCLV